MGHAPQNEGNLLNISFQSSNFKSHENMFVTVLQLSGTNQCSRVNLRLFNELVFLGEMAILFKEFFILPLCYVDWRIAQ